VRGDSRRKFDGAHGIPSHMKSMRFDLPERARVGQQISAERVALWVARGTTGANRCTTIL
jgi:hypothetical protein